MPCTTKSKQRFNKHRTLTYSMRIVWHRTERTGRDTNNDTCLLKGWWKSDRWFSHSVNKMACAEKNRRQLFNDKVLANTQTPVPIDWVQISFNSWLYWRGYGRLLDIPVEDVMALYICILRVWRTANRMKFVLIVIVMMGIVCCTTSEKYFKTDKGNDNDILSIGAQPVRQSFLKATAPCRHMKSLVKFKKLSAMLHNFSLWINYVVTEFFR